MKKKTSFLKIILNTLVILVFLILVAAGSGIGFLYFKYKVNIFTCIDQISKLNGNVNESIAYTEDDYNSIKTKIDSIESTPDNHIEFTDKELCAYLDKNIDKVPNFNFGDTELNLTENDFHVLQIKLNNITVKQPDEKHYCDMNVVIKLNIASVRNAKMNDFPVNILKNFIPDVLYINTDCSIDVVEGNYVVTPTGISINNLSRDATKSFLETINKFIKFTTAEELNQNISSALADALLSDSSVYGVLKEKGATGYGWQSENEFVVYFTDITETHTIVYVDTKDAPNVNPIDYTIRSNKIILENLSANGYNFLGWYTDIDDENSKVEVIKAWDLQDYTLIAKWQIITYTITCDLRGGKIGTQTEYSKTYTIEDASFNLPTNATKTVASLDLPFAGWIGDSVTSLTKVVTIEHGSWGDKHFAAYYEGEDVNLTLVVNGIEINTASIETGTVLSLDNINSLIESKLAGYTVTTWYTNDTQTLEYDYSSQLINNQTLYATSTYLTDNVLFYPYVEKFDYAINHPSLVLKITSHDMLLGYIDYCIFYDVTDANDAPLNLTYCAGYSAQQIVDEISCAANERSSLINKFSKAYTASISCSGGYAHYYLTETDSTEIATNHFNGTPSVYTQQDFALRVDDLNIRDDGTFDDFEIKYVGKTIKVSTSEQLVWVMENGYQPVCETSSAAETVYNKAKEVLRNICSDDMNDAEKLQAIYKWLVLNVSYDQEAFYKYEHNLITSDQAKTYDSWYPEGVFIHGKAVCEGYAKSLLIMAKLEGIPTVCVSGDGHMWNKVYLNGKWYGIDATHGDLSITNLCYEVFTYTAFLFTDTYKTAQGYTADTYTNFTADTKYNTYDNTEFSYHGYTYDLLIDSQAEFNALLNYVDGFSSGITCDYYTLEIATNYYRSEINSWLSSGWSIMGLSERKDSCGNKVYILQHNK